MKITCPNCGHQHEVAAEQQKRAAKSRWSGMTAAERSAAMSAVRRKGVKRAKAKKRTG